LAKAITQYPIFVLILVSLIVLSSLATYIIREIGTATNPRSLPSLNMENTVKYIFVNNMLFIKVNRYYDKVFEIEILSNNTVSKHLLHNYNNTLYGPLIIHPYTMKIILLGKDYDDKYYLLDIILCEKPLTNISISKGNDEKYPPSIMVHPLLRINTLENIYGENKFYILKPYIAIRKITLRKNRIYNITYDNILGRDIEPWSIMVYHGELNDSKTIDESLNEYLWKYGNITQYRTYLLNIYPDKEYQYKLPETYLFNISYENRIIVDSLDKISDISVSYNYSLLEALLKHRILRIYIRDVLGETYIGRANIKYYLVLINDNSNEKYVYLIESINTYTNITDKVVNLSVKKIINETGKYTVYLKIHYEITIPQPINPPVYATIVYSINGAGENDQAIIIYLTDKIIIKTPSENIIQTPLVNNTITTISIHKELRCENYTLNINSTYYLNTQTYNITYEPTIEKPIRVTIYAYPSITAIIANYIQIINHDNNSILYFINETSMYNIVGLYTWTNESILILKYYPVVIDNDEQRELIINNTNTLFYAIINNTFTKIYSEEHSSLQGINLTFNGFYTLSEHIYQEPLLAINYSLISGNLSSIRIAITYIDGALQLENITGNDLGDGVFIIQLQNKPISNITIYLEMMRINYTLLYSIRLRHPIALMNMDNGLGIQIENYYVQRIDSVEYYIVLFRNGTVIYNIKY
jgi:hypothetical protein